MPTTMDRPNLDRPSRSLAIQGAGASCSVVFDPTNFGVIAVDDCAFPPPTAPCFGGDDRSGDPVSSAVQGLKSYCPNTNKKWLLPAKIMP